MSTRVCWHHYFVRLQKSDRFLETFGLPNNVSILDGSTTMLDLKSGKNESTQRLTPSTIDYVKDIVKCFVNSTSSEDHLYCSTHNTPLQIALDAINFYEGLKSLGATRYLSKSRLPSSIGLKNVSLMKQKDVIRSSENSLEHNPAQINETLTGHVRGFGLRIAPVAGHGDCFFSSVAFHVSNLLTATSPHADIVNHLNTMGLSADMAITELARALRALIVEEWTGPNAEEYMNFIEEDVDFNLEAQKYRSEGFFHDPLGDLMPMAMSNVLNLPLCNITSESHTPVISVCPLRTVSGSVPIMLAYTSSVPCHYDALVSMKPLSNSTGSL